MNYRKQFNNHADCDDAAQEWSKNHPGHYYVSWIEGKCYEISSLSEYDGEPYYQNGDIVYPD